jgi:hypothetical protein
MNEDEQGLRHELGGRYRYVLAAIAIPMYTGYIQRG